VLAGLDSLGLKVRRDDIRPVLRDFDRPGGARSARIIRRVYSVPWINSLWHIDGHHKLNPWGFVIHGGIDGFSRMVVFMVAANNNRAESMYDAFQGGVNEFGWPSRVRGDRGQENRDVRLAMEHRHGMYPDSLAHNESQ
jgi:hypothetical protein